ncbi:hypothetical protein BGZ67_006961 [Mortierella alpina]|nr:hypothetical protein BGZ67_006961 [Mortierella alpina]
MAKEERRVKELMDGAKRRAQRRKAFYDSKLGDPMQLLRVSGSSIRLVTNPETYAHNEDPKSLMPWASDPAIKIDRFDGRALLDYLPSTTPAMIESGLQLERDEDGIGNELRFERWHDLADKYRLRVSEEQCLAENEEEWNDLVARHHALIGKVSEKRRDGSDAATPAHQFGFNYGTESIEQEQEAGQLVDRELTSLEEENILDHLDNLSTRDRDILDSMGAEFYIKDYYRLLRRAKADEDTRVNQLKMTAVNLERTLAGKKPLKPSEIDGLNNRCGRRNGQDRRVHNRHRGRSASPAHRSTRRSSPSYAPYEERSSRSGSESPLMDKVEFIVEFQSNTSGKGHDDEPEMDHHSISAGMKLDDAAPSGSSVEAWDKATKKPPTVQHRDVSRTSKDLGTHGSSSLKMSLAEKLKQRMRQGLDQSGE